ncbi:MAG: glycosyltransferase [Cyanobacteria bacterium J06626_14]
MVKSLEHVGLVAIGRNEGSNLRQCLQSVVGQLSNIVYVDSGSTDGSIELAESLGATVVKLDISIPFTAARARNAGFEKLLERDPLIEFVQFVDGDCEIIEGWLEQALSTISEHEAIAVVCGRRRERFPNASMYNLLCDIEWNTPVGETKACGGDALMRASAFKAANGFNAALIAGEEPELCVRLRKSGWTIFRLDAEMTHHDAKMTHFGQWWKRMVRAGHAYAEGSWLHGASPERHWVKESRSIWLWGFIVPAAALGLVPLTGGWSLLVLLIYPILTAKACYSFYRQGTSLKHAALYGYFCILSKLPGVIGQFKFHINRLLSQQSTLIEYK